MRVTCTESSPHKLSRLWPALSILPPGKSRFHDESCKPKMRHEISPGPWPSCPDTGCAVPSSQPPGCREGCVLRPRQEVGTQTLVGPPRCLTSAPASTWSACPEPLSACHRGRGRRRWRGRGGGTRWQPCPQQLCPGSYTWDKS